MTPDEVLKKYRSIHHFHKKTGMSHSSLANWINQGYVPIDSQRKIEAISGGELKADPRHGKDFNREGTKKMRHDDLQVKSTFLIGFMYSFITELVAHIPDAKTKKEYEERLLFIKKQIDELYYKDDKND